MQAYQSLQMAHSAGSVPDETRIRGRVTVLLDALKANALYTDPMKVGNQSDLLVGAATYQDTVNEFSNSDFLASPQHVAEMTSSFNDVLTVLDNLKAKYASLTLSKVEKDIGSLVTRQQVTDGVLILGVVAVVFFVAGRVRNAVDEAIAQANELEERNCELEAVRNHMAEQNAVLESNQEELEARQRELSETLDLAENQKAMSDHASRRFQSLFAGLPVGCMTFDSEGTVMEWNPQMSAIFGIEAHYVILQPLFNAVRSDGRDDEIAEWIKRVVEGGEKVEIDWEFMYEGVKRTVAMAWFPLKDMNRSPVGGIACVVDVTEQRKTERQVREMAVFQHAVLNSADYSIITFSPDGTITGFNRAAEQMLGYSEAEAVGEMNILDMHVRTEIDLRASEIEFETGEQLDALDVVCYGIEKGPTDHEWVYQRQDGSLFDCEVSITMLRGIDEAVSGYVAIGTDVTTEKENRERMRMLSMVASEAANAVLICDANSHILYVNPTFESMTGYRSEDVIGRSPFDLLFGEETDNACRLELVHAVTMRQDIHRDILQYRKDGSTVWVRASLSIIRNESGVSKNIVWIEEDVTERILAEAAAAEANQKTTAILESINDNFFSCGSDMRFTYVNHWAAGVIGVEGGRLTGRKVWNFCRGADWIPVKDHLKEVIETKETKTGEYYFAGIKRHYEFRIYPTEEGASVFFTDITERREALAQLEAKNADLLETTVELEMSQQGLKDANQKLLGLATSDGLTGLTNHRAFQEFFEEAFVEAKESGEPLALMMMDVDNFKKYNDSFGHPAGDKVLKGVAKVLKGIVAEPHLAARYGGEEFVVVLRGLDEVDCLVMAEEIRYEIEGRKWEHREVTMSIGISFLSSTTESRHQLLKEADEALYASKEEGRNRVTAYKWLEVLRSHTSIAPDRRAI